MKHFIIACFATVALMSLSACTTSNDGQPVASYQLDAGPMPNPPGPPIIADPHGPF
jgi:hypothetical protein